MKLLAKTSVYYFILFILLFMAGGIFAYEEINRLFYNQLDDDLLTEKAIIEEEISDIENMPDFSSRFGHSIDVKIFREKIKPFLLLGDTILTDSATMEDINYRHLFAGGNSDKQGYTISIYHPLTETNKLITGILKIVFIMLIPMWLLIVVFNYLLSKKIWMPFYKTIATLNHYDIKDKEKLSFEPNNVHEFTQLNKVLTLMSDKIRSDYFNLKEFTENASHEIQTPLAIIKTKIEMLIQTENLTQGQMELIDSMNKAVSRISKINSGLLLIAKIENNQFEAQSEISILQYIEQGFTLFKDFIQQRNLKTRIENRGNFIVSMNQILAEILISNLINNAVKYNEQSGYIHIITDSHYFSISNPGEPLGIKNPFELFERFKKGNKQFESPGLGLAIVKKICDSYHLEATYQNTDNIHSITITKF